MSDRAITLDRGGTLRVRFPFDRTLVDRIKTLPRRRWFARERCWAVPVQDVVALVDLLAGEGFACDAATIECYVAAGGTLPAEALPSGSVEFDAPATEAAGGAETDYRVGRLNLEARAALERAFPSPVWLVAEVSGFNRNAHRRHVGFQLVERDGTGAESARVAAILFEDARRRLDSRLAAEGDPFRLEDEIEIRVLVRVELYEPWGQYRVRIEDLDPAYTLGEAARRREEGLRRRAADGLTDRNPSLPLAAVPLRVGVVTSLRSDAYNDVVRTLEESGFAFDVTVHGARVQGHSTEPSVLNALDWFRDRAERFDVVLICRGGGSRTDLAWFDSEALGRTVATFPIPVLVGIGHEQDRSVLDGVARSAKTPTAAAACLVERVAEALDRLVESGTAVVERAAGQLSEERAALAERSRRTARATRHLVERARSDLDHGRRRLAGASRARLREAASEVLGRSRALPRRADVLLARRSGDLERAARQLAQGAERDAASARRSTAGVALRLGPAAARSLGRAAEHVEARERRLDVADPRRVVERGYAILRSRGGQVVTGPSQAPAGAAMSAELRDGRLRLRSEGPEETERNRA